MKKIFLTFLAVSIFNVSVVNAEAESDLQVWEPLNCPVLSDKHAKQAILFERVFPKTPGTSLLLTTSNATPILEGALKKKIFPLMPEKDTDEGCGYAVDGKVIKFSYSEGEPIMELGKAFYLGDIKTLKTLRKFFTKGGIADLEGGVGKLSKRYFPTSKGDWELFLKDAEKNKAKYGSLFN